MVTEEEEIEWTRHIAGKPDKKNGIQKCLRCGEVLNNVFKLNQVDADGDSFAKHPAFEEKTAVYVSSNGKQCYKPFSGNIKGCVNEVILYRYESKPVNDEILVLAKAELLEYSVLYETEKGYWIDTEKSYKLKWVSKTGKIRYAYPDKESAMINYQKRTKKYIQILKHRLSYAESALKHSYKQL